MRLNHGCLLKLFAGSLILAVPSLLNRGTFLDASSFAKPQANAVRTVLEKAAAKNAFGTD